VLVPNTLSLEDLHITRRGYTIHHILVSVSIQIYTIYRGFAFRKPDPPFHKFAIFDHKNLVFSSCLNFWLSKPWIRTRIGIQPNMLDPDMDPGFRIQNQLIQINWKEGKQEHNNKIAYKIVFNCN